MIFDQAIATPPTILIVEDTLSNLHILFNTLTLQGYEVHCAKSGTLALMAIQKALPDLILLDIRLPDLDGYEICRQLKASIETHDIPVIFLSALNETLDKVKAFEVGGADYITKPFQMEEVLVRVRHQLTIRSLQQQRKQLIEALEKANQELQNLAILDGLTQVANRRRFDECLTLEWQRLAREQLPLSLILGDIDHFKQYNDTCGHLAGDRCLQLVAQTLRQIVKRPTDLVARYGGEEFIILLPNTGVTEATQLAETIRLAVEQLNCMGTSLSTCEHVSLSLGVACTIPAYHSSSNVLVAMADKAMYMAKEQGRNRVCVYSICDSDDALSRHLGSLSIDSPR